MNRGFQVHSRSKAAEHRRTPKRWRVGYGGPNIRQVLERARCCGALDVPRRSRSQGTVARPRSLSMNLVFGKG